MSSTPSQTRFELTAQKAERQAQANPGIYKLKLLLFALLGYGIIFAVLAALLAVLGGLIYLAIQSTALLLLLLKKKLIFLLIPLIWVLVTALWVKLEAPRGYRVTRKELPQLFVVIDRLSQRLKSAQVHEVLLTPQFNAAVVQTPRLGIFGWNKNTLILGMELLMVLTPKQAESVVAHELGHLSGNHSRFAGWIYRVRQSWYRIMEAFEHKGGMGARLMGRIFDWYAPSFAAYSFALARANEFEADAMAAKITDRQSTGDALVNAHVAAPFVDENYWHNFFLQADLRPEPEHLPWAGLGSWLASDSAHDEDLQQRLDAELERKTSYENTHPCIADRLTALDLSPRVPEVGDQSAANAWLGEKFDKVVADFDVEWAAQQADNWRNRYEYVQESKKSLQTLVEKEIADLSDDELWQRATLTEEFDQPDNAMPLFEQLQQRVPDNPAVAFALGRLNFDRDDDETLRQMKIAAQAPEYAVNACKVAYAYLEKRNRTDEAQWWVNTGNQQAEIEFAAHQERSTLHLNDDLDPPSLSQESVDAIKDAVKATGKVKKAWLAQKFVEHYPDEPVLAIAVVGQGFFVSDESCRETISDLIDLNYDFFVVPKMGDHKKLAKKIIANGNRIL